MTPVEIRGTIYRSIAAAARAQNVNESTASKHLDAGTPHLIGLTAPTPKCPCSFNGIDYPSLAAAAYGEGVTVEAIRQRIKRQCRTT